MQQLYRCAIVGVSLFAQVFVQAASSSAALCADGAEIHSFIRRLHLQHREASAVSVGLPGWELLCAELSKVVFVHPGCREHDEPHALSGQLPEPVHLVVASTLGVAAVHFCVFASASPQLGGLLDLSAISGTWGFKVTTFSTILFQNKTKTLPRISQIKADVYLPKVQSKIRAEAKTFMMFFQ